MTYRERLAAALGQEDPIALSDLLQLYGDLTAATTELAATKTAVKDAMAGTMQNMQTSSYKTPLGSVTFVVPSEPTITYSASALDKLIINDPRLAEVLKPYRKATMKAPYLNVRLAGNGETE